MEYVGFVWRSSSSFDAFENTVPHIDKVVEMIIGAGAGSGPGAGAQVVSTGAASVVIELGSVSASSGHKTMCVPGCPAHWIIGWLAGWLADKHGVRQVNRMVD